MDKIDILSIDEDKESIMVYEENQVKCITDVISILVVRFRIPVVPVDSS